MKRPLAVKMLLALAALHILPTYTSAQRLSITKQTIDVGKTGFEVPVTATFELRNKGVKQLVVEKLKTDCGCTTVDGPQKVAPGEKFTISMTYDARLLGHFHKQVAIYSNATREPVYLHMKGVVLEDVVDYSQRYPYDFGGLLASTDNVEFDDVSKGQQAEMVIELLNNTEKDMTPNILHLPNYITAVAQPKTLEPNRSGKITLTLNTDGVPQYGLTQMSIYLAKRLGERISNDTEIPVSIVLLPDMTDFEGEKREKAPKMHISAETLNLDANHKQGTIILSNEGKSALSISSLQMFTGGIQVKLPKKVLKPGESEKLRISIIPDQIRKARSQPRILMITNDPEQPKAIITINVE